MMPDASATGRPAAPAIGKIAEALLAARRERTAIAASPSTGPADTAAALAVQAAVAGRLGPICGFKTGRSGRDSPVRMAPIAAADLHRDGALVPQRLGGQRMVELEVGFRLTAPPPDPDEPDFEVRLARVVTLHTAIEIVQPRLLAAKAAGPLWKLADALHNDALVLGAPLADWRRLDLAVVTGRLKADDAVIANGPLPVPGGCAFATFAAFARQVGGHCGGLASGHVVITGTLTGLTPVPEGARIEAAIAGVGTVGCIVGGR